MGSLDAVGPLEVEQAEYVALLMWRRRRVSRFEHECLEGAQDGVGSDFWEMRVLNGHTDWDAIPQVWHEKYEPMVYRWMRQRVVPDTGQVETIVRYETHINNLGPERA